LDVRIGGIYALERIARDSPEDHPIVIEVLAAFVRVHSREQWPQPHTNTVTEESVVPPRRTRPDVQTALTVIGRRNAEQDRGQAVDLAGANLTSADLKGALLSGAKLTGVILHNADLEEAHLEVADLEDAIVTEANLELAYLTSAVLYNADLTGAYLEDAELPGASLIGANLSRAHLAGANLQAANLTGARLDTSELAGVILTDAIRAHDDPLPEGWTRDADTGRLRKPET
jgi:hypothetical protein